MLVQRKGCSPKVTEQDLAEIDLALLHFHELFSEHLAPLMPSGGNTIKYHKLSHITDNMRRFGPLKHISTQTFEYAHAPLKRAARATNMQTSGHASSFQLVKQVRMRELAKGFDNVDLGIEHQQYRCVWPHECC